MRSLLLSVLLAAGLAAPGFADEPFLKPNDVIALVGGEDMVAAAEYGYLELLLTRALPARKLKFRCLAWEGDTVFEQRRDLNFPTWEEQLEKIGATVVICQFGQMESLAGEMNMFAFSTAYEKLIKRFRAGGKRRIVVLSQPGGLEGISRGRSEATSPRTPPPHGVHPSGAQDSTPPAGASHPYPEMTIAVAARETRDSIHAAPSGHLKTAIEVAAALSSPGAVFKAAARPRDGDSVMSGLSSVSESGISELPLLERLRQLIIAKNRLWHDYWRVQNWAFLAGDRTEQPSSRDHLDRTKRWFPEERERFLPLIEKKEQEIWELAEKLAKE